MPATGEQAPPVGCVVSAGGGLMHLQPIQVALSPIKFDHYPYKQSLGLGVAQIVLGSLCIVFNAVTLLVGSGVYFDGLGPVGHGFWCGVLFIVTGGLGISAGVSKTKCKIVSYMVLCIISACFTIGLLTCGIIGAVVSGARGPNECKEFGYSMSYGYYYRPPCSTVLPVLAMESCMAVCAFIAAILFIWGSVLCCKAKPCCYTPNSFQQVSFLPNYASNNGVQMIGLPSSQFQQSTMPYEQGVPPVQPNFAQASWTQPQLMQWAAAATAADLYPNPNPTQAFGQGVVGQNSELPPKY